MLLMTSVIIFIALRVIPGDPTAPLALNGATKEQVQEIREELGLDESIPVQYVEWITNAARGDLGVSYFSEFPTTELIKERIGATAILAFVSLGLALFIAVSLGVIGAVTHDRSIDRAIGVLASFGVAFPSFWLAMLVLAVFSVKLGWLPSRGYTSFHEDPVEALRHLILPAVTLALVIAAPVLRFLRAMIFEMTSADFVRTARSKGVPERTVALRHIIPNAAVPTISYVAIIAGHLLGGVVVIEAIFGWPGIGGLAINAVTQRDYIVLQGTVLFAAATFIAVTIIADLITIAIDPRLRPGHAR
jgi:peptide/nickel transport system permease protein